MDGRGSYDDLVALLDEFTEWRDSNFTYDTATVAAREKEMEKFQARLTNRVPGVRRARLGERGRDDMR